MIPGLYYYENAVTESDLIQQLMMYRWEKEGTTMYQRYKPNFLGYNTLPTCLHPLRQQVTDICKKIIPTHANHATYFNECLIVQYEIGEGMANHCAYPTPGHVTGTFILGGGATLLFSKNDMVEELYTHHHSLYILEGDASWKWSCCMPAALYDTVKGEKVFRERRIAITFRHILP